MTELDRLFVPSLMLPAQQPARYLRGEPGVLELLLAVLEEAIRNAAGVVVSCASPRRRLAFVEEARAWLLAPDDGYVFACRTICGALGIDPDAFQAEVSAGLAASIGRHVRRSGPRGARVALDVPPAIAALPVGRVDGERRVKTGQGELFELPDLPDLPDPHDRVEVCTACGRRISVERHDGTIVSGEYRSARGECWECARRDCGGNPTTWRNSFGIPTVSVPGLGQVVPKPQKGDEK